MIRSSSDIRLGVARQERELRQASTASIVAQGPNAEVATSAPVRTRIGSLRARLHQALPHARPSFGHTSPRRPASDHPC